MTTRLALLILLSTVMLLPTARGADEPVEIPSGIYTTLSRAVRDLGKAGHPDEATELLEILSELGLPEKRAATIRKQLEREKPRKAKPAPRAAKAIRKAAEKLAALLPTRPEAERKAFARLLVRLDDECAAAQTFLGREKRGSRWLTPEDRKGLERRTALHELIRSTRKRELEIRALPKASPWIELATGVKGRAMAWRNIEAHAMLPPTRLERVLRVTVQAALIGNYLVSGKADFPSLVPHRFYLMETKEQYVRAVRAAVAKGKVKLLPNDPMANGKWWRENGVLHCFYYDNTEAYLETGMLVHLFPPLRWKGDPKREIWYGQATIEASTFNLLCLLYIGVPAPGYIWVETGNVPRKTVAKGEESGDWRLVRYPSAGPQGHRRWLRYLLAEEKCPPWSRCFVDDIGKLEGDEAIKSTSVVEFLWERGRLADLAIATWPDRPEFKGQPLVRVYETGLGHGLDQLEREWEAWLLNEHVPGLASRVGGAAPARKVVPGAKELLVHLNAIRYEADQMDLIVDAELSDGCLLHAKYLSANPEQTTKWPDAHEEYPDREGYAIDGAWAGLHSVIAPGVKTPPEAVDAWMGTFYHRLPLLDPGLLAVGWGFHDDIAVLDSGSLVMLTGEEETRVAWPVANAKNVPLRFNPELPNPVPGEDQSTWGYPITLGVWRPEGKSMPRIEMELHAGKENGPVVPCHFSTPDAPTNPQLAPEYSWCLMPKQHLSPGSQYTVVAKFVGEGERMVWSFHTGSR